MNINRENFFNEIEQQYPLAFAEFTKKLADFEIANTWREFIPSHNFYELPYPLQYGVIVQTVQLNKKEDTTLCIGGHLARTMALNDAFKRREAELNA